MAKENRKDSSGRGGFHVQFNLPGLVIFSVSLVLAAGVLAFVLARPSASAPAKAGARSSVAPNSGALSRAVDGEPEADTEGIPPWGEFMAQDIQLERPEEFTAMELENVEQPKWTFAGMKSEQVRELMAACGLTPQQ